MTKDGNLPRVCIPIVWEPENTQRPRLFLIFVIANWGWLTTLANRPPFSQVLVPFPGPVGDPEVSRGKSCWNLAGRGACLFLGL